MSEIKIYVEGLSKSLGKKQIIENCSFLIEQGSIFGLVGLNGAGKTTLIRLLLGLLKPDCGKTEVNGFIPWLHAGEFYRKTGVILEHDGFAGNLNIKDNIGMFAAAKGVAWRDVIAYIKEFWSNTFIHDEGLSGRKKVKYLSRGQKVQCGLCRAFMGWPDVYLFDEPTVALDVEAYDHFVRMCIEAKRRGGTMLVSSHQLSTIEELCDIVGILDNKRLHLLTSDSAAPVSGQWEIMADYSDDFRIILERCSGFPAKYADGMWHCNINNPENAIPEIVTQLAAAGCRIRQICPESNGIREKIRRHYETN